MKFFPFLLLAFWYTGFCKAGQPETPSQGQPMHSFQYKGGILRIEDKTGKTLREFQLANVDGTYREETRIIPEGPKSPSELEQKLRRDAVISWKGISALIEEIVVEREVIRTSSGKREGDNFRGTFTKLEYWTSAARPSWSKQLRRNNEVFDVAISNDASVISFIEGCNFGCDRKDPETRTRLRVFALNGDEILTFPRKSDDCEIVGGPYVITGDGRYIFSKCEHGLGVLPTTIGFDIRKMRVWRPPFLAAISINDQGDIAQIEGVRMKMQDGRAVMEKFDVHVRLDNLEWASL